jgi:hypothetical protein
MDYEEMKSACEERIKELEHDSAFIELCNDLSNITSAYFVTKYSQNIVVPQVQKYRYRYMKFEPSEEQKKFNNDIYTDYISIESKITSRANVLLQQSPVYTRYLKNIAGVDAVSAIVLLSEFKPWKANFVSSMYLYAGIIQPKDGKKQGCNKKLRDYLLNNLANNFIINNSEYTLEFYSSRIRLIQADLNEIVNGTMEREFPTQESILKYDNLVKRYQKEGRDISEIKKPRRILSHHKKIAKRAMIQRFIRDYYRAFRIIYNIPDFPLSIEIGNDEKKAHVGTDFTSHEMFLDIGEHNDEKYITMRNTTTYKLSYLIPSLQEMIVKGGYNITKQ